MVSFGRQFSLVVLLSAFTISLVSCHTNMISLNGNKGCVRRFPNNSPITDVKSDQMKCYGASELASSRCSFAAGETVWLKYYHSDSQPVDPSHKGPIAVYLASAESNGNGASWFKIAERGLNNGQWAVDELVANRGDWKVVLPSNLRAGNYILRTELLALHSAGEVGGAQFYVGCADITVTGGGDADCSPKVSIPGDQWVSSSSDESVKVNIYWPPLTAYKIPGPALASCVASDNSENNNNNNNNNNENNNFPEYNPDEEYNEDLDTVNNSNNYPAPEDTSPPASKADSAQCKAAVQALMKACAE